MQQFFRAMPVLLLLSSLYACTKNQTDNTPASAKKDADGKAVSAAVDYRQEMRNFVIRISRYAKGISPGFAIVPQNGPEILTTNGETDGPMATAYVDAIDGVGREDLLYGYDGKDNVPTPPDDVAYWQDFCNRIKATKKVLVTDYCSTRSYVDRSYAENKRNGYVSFAADHRGLDNIPAYPAQPYNVHSGNVAKLMDVKNFLYLIDPGQYSSKQALINAVNATSYDLLIIDLFFHPDQPFTAAEIDQLKRKANGGKRMVIAYMSIGEAESYRYYWQPGWAPGNPPFIHEEDPDWQGNYYCAYWDTDWQDIIFGKTDSYLKKIIDAHFDGTYLDLIDAYDYFENKP